MKQVLPLMFTNLVLLYEGIKDTKEKVFNNKPIKVDNKKIVNISYKESYSILSKIKNKDDFNCTK